MGRPCRIIKYVKEFISFQIKHASSPNQRDTYLGKLDAFVPYFNHQYQAYKSPVMYGNQSFQHAFRIS